MIRSKNATTRAKNSTILGGDFCAKNVEKNAKIIAKTVQFLVSNLRLLTMLRNRTPAASPPHVAPDQYHGRALRAEEAGFSNPGYEQEQGNKDEPVINSDKDVYHRDGFTFVNRLEDLAKQSRPVRDMTTTCFRDSALS